MSHCGSLAAAHRRLLPLRDNEWSQFREGTSPGSVQVAQQQSDMLAKITAQTRQHSLGRISLTSATFILPFCHQKTTRKTCQMIISVQSQRVQCYGKRKLHVTWYRVKQRLTASTSELTLPAGCSTSLLCGAATASRAASSPTSAFTTRPEMVRTRLSK